jgi:hypothetical protein
MDAIAEGRDDNPVLTPFMRTHQSQEFSQRHQGLPFAGTIGLRAGESKIGSAAERNFVVSLKGHQEHA